MPGGGGAVAALGLRWPQHPALHEGKIKVTADGPVAMEDFVDGWPGYEEPVFVHH